MLVGYARTSTVDQEAGLDAQIRDLKAAGCEEIFSEKVSSVATRAKLEDALTFVRKGDTLCVSKPDRLARSTSNLLAIVERLEKKGAGLRILSMGGSEIDTKTATGKMMLTMLAAVAEFERALMLERQIEGIAKAKAEKKYKGRAPTARNQTEAVLKMKAAGHKPAMIVEELGISMASYFRILKAVQQAAV
jgi:DNA invertase Pin-like site-specific DNA recombinase